MVKFHRVNGKLKRTTGTKAPKDIGWKTGMPVKILFDTQKCKFLTLFPPQLNKALVAPYPNYWHTPSFKAKQWDGMYHFITKAGYFPTGLLPVVFHMLTTATNPLMPEDIEKNKLRFPPVKDIKILPKKGCAKVFTESYPRFFSFPPDTMIGFDKETGTFAYPVPLLKCWAAAKGTNPLAKKVLAFAKTLREEAMSEE